jgi:hypothetical protein
MIGYIIGVMNGDIDKIMNERQSMYLTWLEEWYLYFVMVWG